MIKIQFNLWTLISVGIVLCASTVAYSQQDAMKQNALALRQYTWKSQTQIRKEGEVKATKLYSSRYAADGTVVQLLLEEESAKLPKFGILRPAAPVGQPRHPREPVCRGHVDGRLH